MPEPWMAGAACRGLTSLMFAERGDTYTTSYARAVCDTCPVWSECLDWSMTPDAPRDGVIAGLTPKERQELRRDVQSTTIAVSSVVDITRRRRVADWWVDVPRQPPDATWTRDELLEARAADVSRSAG